MKRLLAVFALLVVISYGSEAWSETTVWAVGGKTILRNDAGAWAPASGVPSNSCSYRRLWGTTSNNVYIAGGLGELLHYDGTTWQRLQRLTFPDTMCMLMDVKGTNSINIYTIGYRVEDEHPYSGYNYLLHYDGSTWSGTRQEDLYSRFLTDICVLSNGSLHAIAWYQNYFQRTFPFTALRYTAGTWSVDQPFSSVDESHVFRRVSSLPGTNYVAMTGEGMGLCCMWGNLIAEKDSGAETLWSFASRSDSCGDYPVYPQCPYWSTAWEGTWLVSSDDLWCCGSGGAVLHWTSSGYTEYATPTTATLRSIWAESNTNVYAVGDDGAIVHYDGVSWSAMESGTTTDLVDVFGTPVVDTGTFLQSFSVEGEISRVVVQWWLSEYDEGTTFRIERMSRSEGGAPIVDEHPALERTGLSFVYVDRDITPGRTYVYRVEHSDGGSWRLLFETEAVSVPEAALALTSIYPNPFNPSTTISYSVPERGRATLRIYDAAGKVVRTLLDEEKAAGDHSIRWDGLTDQGRPASSGAYFCRLESAKKSTSRKLLLLR